MRDLVHYFAIHAIDAAVPHPIFRHEAVPPNPPHFYACSFSMEGELRVFVAYNHVRSASSFCLSGMLRPVADPLMVGTHQEKTRRPIIWN